MGLLRWTYPGENGYPWGMVDCLPPTPPRTHTPTCAHNSTHPPPLAGCYQKLRERNKAMKWQGHQDGTDCCTSWFLLNCHHPTLVTHTCWKQARARAHAHTHAAASCLLLSQDYSSLSLFVCQPQTGKHGLLKMEVHSFIVGKCLILLSRA